jgi:peptidoglycan/xylan/chitin deacetylase (PgdA/CDA1 family)
MFKIFIAYFFLAIFINTYLFSQDKHPDRYVSVTFDDLPINSKYLKDGNQWVEQNKKIISTLKKYNIPAIGFVNEYKLYVNDKLDSNRLKALQLWIEADLDIGNHTYSHPDYHKIDEKVFFGDIIKGEKITKELLFTKNRKLKYFRHPYLHTGNTQEKKYALTKFLSEHSYTVAPVTIDNGEWIYARAYENAFNNNDTGLMQSIGTEYVNYMIDKIAYFENQSVKLFGYEIKQILLVHANILNADYFDELAEAIMNRNYSFVSLDEALRDSAYNSEDTFIGRSGISWLHRWSYTKKVDKSFFDGEPEVPQNILDIAGIKSE